MNTISTHGISISQFQIKKKGFISSRLLACTSIKKFSRHRSKRGFR